MSETELTEQELNLYRMQQRLNWHKMREKALAIIIICEENLEIEPERSAIISRAERRQFERWKAEKVVGNDA